MTCSNRSDSTPATAEFLAYLRERVGDGVSLQAIGAQMGVTHACMSRWLSGQRRVPRMALVLAGYLMRDQSGEWPLR